MNVGGCNKPSANRQQLAVEGNRRDCSMSGNQTSGKEGGVQYIMMVVSICMLDIVYVCLIPGRCKTQACRLIAG